MPSPSVTHSFSNSTTADATQVNTNFTDLINAMSDGTKDFSINALTCAGAATLNGNVTLGNASGDDITFTGSLASSLAIKTTYSYDIGSATIGLRSVYLGSADSAARSTRVIGATVASSWTLTLPTAAGTSQDWLIAGSSGATSFSSTVTTAKMIDGSADSIQMRVQGHTTQTNSIFTVENSSGTVLFGVYGTTTPEGTGKAAGRLFGSTSMHRALSSTQDTTSTTTPFIESGTYTPTLSASSNLTSSSAYAVQWLRVGRVVTVSGRMDVDPVDATAWSIEMSLPIASDIGAQTELGGAGSLGSTGFSCSIKGTVANNTALFDGAGTGTSTQCYFSFTYLVS